MKEEKVKRKEVEKKIEEEEKEVRKRGQEVPQQKDKKVRKNMRKNRRCYKCGGLSHIKRDHKETERQKKPRWQKKEVEEGTKK